ncbi:hypothetical protein [Streptomyces milbemycinicus]|uniref:hypothetical protein n=1 Tax=Streptomyces milbemycinicus TaxID=476552 RepID=UPI003401C6F7
MQADRDLGLSWPVVQRCFEDSAAKVLPETPPETEAIGMDETRRGKPVWKQNPTTGKCELVADAWHIGFVDTIGGQGLFSQAKGRDATSVADWLTAQPASWREQVRYVASDLCSTFLRCPPRPATRDCGRRLLPHRATRPAPPRRPAPPLYLETTRPPGPQGRAASGGLRVDSDEL